MNVHLKFLAILASLDGDGGLREAVVDRITDEVRKHLFQAISVPRAEHRRATQLDVLGRVRRPQLFDHPKRDKIFEPFQRAGQETGPIQGTGIGLAISRRLAGLMNGRVDSCRQNSRVRRRVAQSARPAGRGRSFCAIPRREVLLDRDVLDLA